MPYQVVLRCSRSAITWMSSAMLTGDQQHSRGDFGELGVGDLVSPQWSASWRRCRRCSTAMKSSVTISRACADTGLASSGLSHEPPAEGAPYARADALV